MTKREIAEMLTVIQTNYPNTSRMSDAAFQTNVCLWHEFFAEYPKEIVYAAAKSYMALDTKGFMPCAGQIIDHIQRLKHSDEMTPAEAWGLVYKAVCNSYYNAAEEFAKLPPECQKAVGDPQQLREWATMDADTVQSVIGSTFQSSFKIRQERDKDFEKLPGNVKQFISQIASNTFGYLDDGKNIGGKHNESYP